MRRLLTGWFGPRFGRICVAAPDAHLTLFRTPELGHRRTGRLSSTLGDVVTYPVPNVQVADAAARLSEAARSGRPCRPVRDLIGSSDVETAYAVQQQLTQARLDDGASVVGRKIGVTSKAVQAQLGVDQPDFGVLFDDMRYGEADTIPFARLLQPKIEAEVAFVLEADLIEGLLDPDQVREAVRYVVAALEIVDSRIEGWDITFGDTVADNASSGLFVLGSRQADLASLEPREVEMRMFAAGQVVSTGTGTACLGDPLNALRWLALTARDLGQPLLAGQVILSGALGPMVTLNPDTVVTAEITGLGSVTANFGTVEQGALS